MEQALKEVNTLTVTLLTKEFSSDNLESIFKVRCAISGESLRSKFDGSKFDAAQ